MLVVTVKVGHWARRSKLSASGRIVPGGPFTGHSPGYMAVNDGTPRRVRWPWQRPDDAATRWFPSRCLSLGANSERTAESPASLDGTDITNAGSREWRAICPPSSTPRWGGGAERVRMTMNNAEVVAFSSENVGHSQLLDDFLVSATQQCLGSLNIDKTSEVFGNVREQICTGPDTVAGTRAGPVQAWPDEVPALFKAAEGAQDRDIVAMREEGLQWLGVALDERSPCCGQSFAQSGQRLTCLSHRSIVSGLPGHRGRAGGGAPSRRRDASTGVSACRTPRPVTFTRRKSARRQGPLMRVTDGVPS